MSQESKVAASRPGYVSGLISFVMAVIIAILLVITMISPSPSNVAYPALILAGGTIVSVILLGSILVNRKR
ncbi:MAG TPA: hypothetical protein VFF30_07940 [Nitrososphaerales archaeon]|nr:hypothetical protein [Nitrososphaerales archaeon]